MKNKIFLFPFFIILFLCSVLNAQVKNNILFTPGLKYISDEEIRMFQNIPLDIDPIINTSNSTNAQVPDSMLEFKSYQLTKSGMIEFGEYYYKTIYYWNNDMLDSVLSYNYDFDTESKIKTEYKYNNKGLLISSTESSTNSKYEYDNTDKLVLVVTKNNNFTDSTKYLYNADNQLVYKISIRQDGSWPSYYLDKYTYAFSDTLRVTTHYEGSPNFSYVGVFELFSDWTNISKIMASFDSLNRKTSEIIESGQGYSNKIYKAEYTYNESNNVKNIVYSEPTENPDSAYKEIMRVTNYYTEKGDIYFYEKTFFDDNTNTWEIMESKTYYYSGLTTSAASKSIEIKSHDLMVYPNPSSEMIYIQRMKDADAQYTIYNVQGIQVKEGVMTGNEINISDLYNGLFIIVIQNDQKTYYGKFMKK